MSREQNSSSIIKRIFTTRTIYEYDTVEFNRNKGVEGVLESQN